MVSPDETLVMTTGEQGFSDRAPAAATLWSLRDGRRVQRIPGKVVWGAFSPDTRTLAVFVDRDISRRLAI